MGCLLLGLKAIGDYLFTGCLLSMVFMAMFVCVAVSLLLASNASNEQAQQLGYQVGYAVGISGLAYVVAAIIWILHLAIKRRFVYQTVAGIFRRS